MTTKLTTDQLEAIRIAAARHCGLDPEQVTMMISDQMTPEAALAEVIADLEELKELKERRQPVKRDRH